MNSAGASPDRRLIVLGSTGSIGQNTLRVVQHLNETGAASIQPVALAAQRSAETLISQARAFDVKHVAIGDETLAETIQTALPEACVYAGADGARQMVEAVTATDLAAAMVGVAGLEATLAGIERGMRISLANKETLVAAGPLVKAKVKQHGATLVPVDSEHAAIAQCLDAQPVERIKRVVLTASGGPFRTWSKAAIERASVEQALAHPTWAMGKKITIDSATMMNKTLELIEAHWLFDLPGEKLSAICHPQSIVHSFVEFTDHSVLAQLGPPDMKTPIQYALTAPARAGSVSEAMDWTRLSELTFEMPDEARFPALSLGYKVIDLGGTAGAVLNAANEAAVAAFLDRRIAFGQISALAAQALKTITPEPVDSLETVLEADRQGRAFVERAVERGDLSLAH
jgi:1-deoxy-D-xylulose-5-phosphate reductoisomerase